MSRAFDLTVMTVIYVVAIIVHLMGVQLFAPSSPLHVLASSGTGAMDGAARADLWYEMLSLWVPLIAMVGITAWSIIREYRRQAITAVRAR